MLSRFRIRSRNREIVDDLYYAIVERSRLPKLFEGFGLPDTVMGRFESLSIHVFLFLARCREEEAVKPLAQDIVDRFVSDIEDSIREIGIGDVAVPKRMRKLAGMFYERVAAYDRPLLDADAAALAGKLERHALSDAALDRRDARGLAAYMIETKAELDAIGTDRMLAGGLFEGSAAS